jgi:hypothetical protein
MRFREAQHSSIRLSFSKLPHIVVRARLSVSVSSLSWGYTASPFEPPPPAIQSSRKLDPGPFSSSGGRGPTSKSIGCLTRPLLWLESGPKHAVDVLRPQRLTNLSRHPVQGEFRRARLSLRVRSSPDVFELVLLCHDFCRGRCNPALRTYLARHRPLNQAGTATGRSRATRSENGTIRSYSFHWPAAMPQRYKNRPSALPPLR